VTFPAWAGAMRVTCRITDEALKAVFGAGASDTDLVETFERCRASIETAAIKKFELAGDPMKLVLVSTDFETRAPIKSEPQPKSATEVAAMMKRYRTSAGGRSPNLMHSPELDEAMAALDAESGDADDGATEAAEAEESRA